MKRVAIYHQPAAGFGSRPGRVTPEEAVAPDERVVLTLVEGAAGQGIAGPGLQQLVDCMHLGEIDRIIGRVEGLEGALTVLIEPERARSDFRREQEPWRAGLYSRSPLVYALDIGRLRLEAERRGWRTVAVHNDSGVSGLALSDREGLRRLREDVAGGKLDVVIVESLDRLAMSPGAQMRLLTELASHDVAILALDQPGLRGACSPASPILLNGLHNEVPQPSPTGSSRNKPRYDA